MNWMNWLYLGLWAMEGIYLLTYRYFLKEKPNWLTIFSMWFLGVLTLLNFGFLGG